MEKLTNDASTERSSIYDIQINDLAGKHVDLKQFKGKHILIVNVASHCGFTPQYRELQELQETYPEKLAVVGVPCNQFGKQEPDSPEVIQNFCEVTYGVGFLLTEKVKVKGKQQHPLYQWLTKKANNGKKNSKVKWNFQKYLIDDKGQLVDYFYSITRPTNSRITSYFV
ncbi:glutathione peroxidase [Winogradskyella maritima]|uniref:Glutathione peroxidase n=1 Tax=Winogradskyella maritima TaxID=1517766 RepID=A0ABV8AGI8_9FLAO|nr:glutathione peroxidase [Winogradskyella maritima]